MKKPAILITAGPTREYLDPVRFISNASSGKMGAALAREAAGKGFDVTVVTGPVAIDYGKRARIIKVTTAGQMLDAVEKRICKCDAFCAAAAVADYRPAAVSAAKIKKSRRGEVLRLAPTEDILAKAAAMARKSPRNPVIVGFALESPERLAADARNKLARKKCDIVVGNVTGAMENAKTSGIIVRRNGTDLKFAELPKSALARRIISEIMFLCRKRNP